MVVDQRGVDAWNLVSANRSPHAAAANGNTTRHLAGRHGLCQWSDIVGVIIVGFELVGAEIDYFVTRIAKLGYQLFFQTKAAVVSGNTYFHDLPFSGTFGFNIFP